MVSVLSFFSTKKNPTPAGDNEGQMMLAVMESLMFCPMASLCQERTSSTGVPQVETCSIAGQ